ncbi:MAG: class I SAM-dependent methyltransferase [Candidatus Hodarchaeales archaeon]
MWPTIDSVRSDHKGRYRFACSYVPKDGKVLDIACGIGYGSFIISTDTSAKEIVAVDISEEALKYGSRHYRTDKIKFVKDDAYTVSLPDNYFDLVVSFETVEHLAQPKLFLVKLYNSLKPNGSLIISTPNENLMHWRHTKHHFRHYTPEQLVALLNICGFSVVSKFSQHSENSTDVLQGIDGLWLVMVCRKKENR